MTFWKMQIILQSPKCLINFYLYNGLWVLNMITFYFFLSNGAPYMQNLYFKMIHITCMAHAIHEVAEEIRTNVQDINKKDIKNIFESAISNTNF